MVRATAQTPYTYPHGVPCWIEHVGPDPQAAARFYADVLGWEWTDALPSSVPGQYLIATLDDLPVAAFSEGDAEHATWMTYVAVTDPEDLQETTRRCRDAGASIEVEPVEVGPAGSMAQVRDPEGAVFRLWSPARRLGAQVVNEPGSWNWSQLHTPSIERSAAFYRDAVGWGTFDMSESMGMTPFTVDGYGEHLLATVRPHLREEQRGAPEGFADVVARAVEISTTDDGARGAGDTDGADSTAHWRTLLMVGDRDAAREQADGLGAEILRSADEPWLDVVVLRDPQGALVTLSRFAPPAD